MLDICPLVDKKGRPLKLSSIKYEHLTQLQNEQIEEGYSVEYKSRWYKKFIDGKLCQTISSFANSSGGWLFIGIEDDGSICEINKEKHDFSQQIGNLLAAHVSPIPVFECRFIRKTVQHNSGVLVIHVFEGANPPYVSKGTIYVRNGSNKTPINANRSDIDNLIGKSGSYKKMLNDLITNPIAGSTIKTPYCIVAMCNLKSTDNRILLKDIERIEHDMKELGILANSIRTAESVIFLGSDSISPNSVTSYVELFYNTNIRIVIYLPCYSMEHRDFVKDYIRKKDSKLDLGDFVLVDFCALILFISTMVNGVTTVVNKLKQELSQYSMQCEFHKTRDSILYFEPADEFWDYMKANGMKYSIKDTQRSFVDQIIKAGSRMEESYFVSQVYKNFAHAFGYDFKEFLSLHESLFEKHPENFSLRDKTFNFNYNRT